MVFFGPKVLLLLTTLIMSSGRTPLGVSGQRGDDVTTVTSETFTEDPNLVNDPATDETVLADIKPSTDDLASLNDKNTTTGREAPKFHCLANIYYCFVDFPGGSAGQELACNAEDLGSTS